MKFFVAFTLIVAVASARFIKPTPVGVEASGIQEIIAAIQSPSTDPATAAALEQMLEDYLATSPIAVGPAIVEHPPISVGPAIVDHHPISVGPAIVDSGDIAVGPAIIDFPLPDGGAVSAPVEVSPVAVGPAANPASSPLVQIIVNVNAPAGVAPVADDSHPVVDPVQVVDEVIDPVHVVDTPIVVDPVQVVDISPVVDVDPVQVVDIAPVVDVDPVQVVDVAPVVISPVAVGTPVLPSPAINLPEELN